MCLMRTVTVSSVPTRTKAFGAKAAAKRSPTQIRAAPGCADAAPGKQTPMTSPATPFSAARRERRMSWWVMSASQRRRGVLDGCTDAHAGGAPADIAVHRQINVAIARFGRLAQQPDCAHYLAGLAVPALRHIARSPGPLHRV